MSDMPESFQLDFASMVCFEDHAPSYLYDRVIGEGFAETFCNSSARHSGRISFAKKADTGELVAIKKVPLSPKNEEICAMEIYMLMTCSHPNIAKYHESFKCGEELWIVLEAMVGGCLTDVLVHYDTYPLNEPQMAYVCHEVFKPFCLANV